VSTSLLGIQNAHTIDRTELLEISNVFDRERKSDRLRSLGIALLYFGLSCQQTPYPIVMTLTVRTADKRTLNVPWTQLEGLGRLLYPALIGGAFRCNPVSKMTKLIVLHSRFVASMISHWIGNYDIKLLQRRSIKEL